MEVQAHNINVWDGSGPVAPPVQAGIAPDPSTGSLRGSQTPMQDDPAIYASFEDAPYAAPPIVTLPGLLDNPALGAREIAVQSIPFIV